MNLFFVALVSVLLATGVFNTEPRDSDVNTKTEIIVKESSETKLAEEKAKLEAQAQAEAEAKAAELKAQAEAKAKAIAENMKNTRKFLSKICKIYSIKCFQFLQPVPMVDYFPLLNETLTDSKYTKYPHKQIAMYGYKQVRNDFSNESYQYLSTHDIMHYSLIMKMVFHMLTQLIIRLEQTV